MNHYYFAYFFLITISLPKFLHAEEPQPSVLVKPAIELLTPEQQAASDNAARLQQFIDPQLADGFDFPIGDVNAKGSYQAPNGKKYSGWYIATNFAEDYSLGIHTGEDWNGNGGGDTDLGQPIYSIGHGRVIYAQKATGPYGNIVVIEHYYLENGQRKRIFSQYDHLHEMKVVKDQLVKRRDLIGTIGKGDSDRFPAHLHFEIRKDEMAKFSPEFWPSSNGWTTEMVQKNYEQPSSFINEHRKLTHPATAAKIFWAIKSTHQMHLIKKGQVIKTYEVALSQKPLGHKQAEGDLKMPEGEYHILSKAKGPFDGEEWRKFLGAAWIRLDYPNSVDARVAYAENRISKEVMESIIAAQKRKVMPPQNTALGGGIGIHGWAENGWDPAGSRALTWGCLSLNQDDLLEIFAEASSSTPVIISP
jgi:murein DD-endopeptidase MepM/ murein hydrolase activator NlpD